MSRRELSLEQVQRLLDELAERRLLSGLTPREHDEYQALIELEARYLAQRRGCDARS